MPLGQCFLFGVFGELSLDRLGKGLDGAGAGVGDLHAAAGWASVSMAAVETLEIAQS